MRTEDLRNRKFNRLTAIKLDHIKYNKKPYWLCLCVCGNKKVIWSGNLKNGNTQSCGCLHKEKISLPTGKAAFNSLFASYKRNAKVNNCSFNLTKSAFRQLTSSNCYYCDKKPTQIGNTTKRINGHYYYNGIDKINPKKGYIKGNVVACCWKHNKMKGDLTLKEFKNEIKKIYRWMFT